MISAVVFVDSMTTHRLISTVQFAFSPQMMGPFMEQKAWPYWSGEIVNAFAYNGRSGIVGWPPLDADTIYSRHARGYYNDDDINIETGDMFNFVTSHHEVQHGASWTELHIPGQINDPVMKQKIALAQGGSDTQPPRPFYTVEPRDVVRMIQLLQLHVIETVRIFSSATVPT